MTGVQTCALPICFPVTIRSPTLMGLYPVTSLLTGSPKGLTISFTVPAIGLSYVGNKSRLRAMAVVASSSSNSAFGYAYKDFDSVAGSPVSGLLDIKFVSHVPSASFVYFAVSALEAPSSTQPVTFGSDAYLPANISVRAIRESNQEVSFDNYPFATASNPSAPRLLAYRFRAYEAVYNAYIS